MLTSYEPICPLGAGAGEMKVEILEEGVEAEDGADNGRVEAIGEGAEGDEEDDEEVVPVVRRHGRGLAAGTRVVAWRFSSGWIRNRCLV